MAQPKKIILLDSNAIIHRAFHALPPLSTKSGVLTNAVYGYALALLSVLEKFQPQGAVALFDLKAPTFRHLKYENYKATRKKAPDELYAQIPLVKDLVRAFGIPVWEKEGFEADDLIGSLARSEKLANYEKIIVTGDLDALQLIDKKTKVYVFRKGIKDALVYDEKAVKERFGLLPEQLKSYKGLCGDVSDNIPGVKGIGEKTATDLIQKFGDLFGIYANLEKIDSSATRKKLEDGRKEAFLSYELGEIRTDIPLEDWLLKNFFLPEKKYQQPKILDFFARMEFHSLIKRLSEKDKQGIFNRPVKEIKVRIVSSMAEVEKLLTQIEETKQIFLTPFDSKTIGKGWGICVSDRGYFLPNIYQEQFWDFFSRRDILKIGHGLQDWMLYFAQKNQLKIAAWYNFFDLKIVFYLLKPEAKNDWESLAAMELGEEIEKKKAKKIANLFSFMDASSVKEEDFLFLAKKALLVRKLYFLTQKKIENFALKEKKAGNFFSGQELLEKVELPLIAVLAQMEKQGFRVSREKLEATSRLAQERIDSLEKEIFLLTGEIFNLNSPQQLAEVLFQKLHLPTAGIKKGKLGFSTDAEQLGKLRMVHPVIEKIERFREIAKLKNTYADALPLAIAQDGRIHAHFNQALTATGRLSCENPNLQNIPKKGELAEQIRQAFVAERGYKLLSVDYSQIDLRVAAHLSGDKKMVEAFQQNKDIHRITAAWVNGIPEEKVSPKQRNEAKALNFGVLYGMGIYGFMRDSGVNRKRAEFFIAEYMRKFSGLKDYLERTKEEAKRQGFLETQMGRRRYIVGFERQFGGAERMAINFPIQGLAADIMKLAMVKIFQDFPVLWEDQEIKMILQVHDELIFEVAEEKVEEWAMKIKNSMEQVYPLKVPLVAETEIGNTWAEL
mgnify:CR=1 FL=1